LKLIDVTKFDTAYYSKAFAFLFKLLEISSMAEDSTDSMEIDGAAEQPVDIGKLTLLVKDVIHKLEVPMNLLTLVVKEMEMIQKRSRQDICGSIGNMELVP
jgi:hypothetical protein